MGYLLWSLLFVATHNCFCATQQLDFIDPVRQQPAQDNRVNPQLPADLIQDLLQLEEELFDLSQTLHQENSTVATNLIEMDIQLMLEQTPPGLYDIMLQKITQMCNQTDLSVHIEQGNVSIAPFDDDQQDGADRIDDAEHTEEALKKTRKKDQTIQVGFQGFREQRALARIHGARTAWRRAKENAKRREAEESMQGVKKHGRSWQRTDQPLDMAKSVPDRSTVGTVMLPKPKIGPRVSVPTRTVPLRVVDAINPDFNPL